MADENPDPESPLHSDPETESLLLKTLAEQKYVAGNLKSAFKYAKRIHRLHPSLDGVEEMLAAFEILRTAAVPISPEPTDDATSSTPTPPDYYKILQVERFAHINTIKKQYRKLALALHPDKNPFAASEEAFKYVGEGFRVLSDRIRRKEYDMKLRIAMQNEAEAAAAGLVEGEEMQTFWTACSTCRLLHKFERKYLGHILVCPSCKKSFKAEEAVDENAGPATVLEGEEKLLADVRSSKGIKGKRVDVRSSKGIKATRVNVRSSKGIKAKKAGKMSTVGEVLERLRRKNAELRGKRGEKGLESVGKERGLGTNEGGGLEVIEDLREKGVTLGLENVAGKRSVGSSSAGVTKGLRSRSGRKEERIGEVELVKGMRTRSKSLKVADEEMITLAEMQMLIKKKLNAEKLKGKEREKDKKEMEDSKKGEGEEKEKEKEKDEEAEVPENENMEEKEKDEEIEVPEKDKENENMEEKEDEGEKDMEMDKEVEMEEAEETRKDRGNKKQKVNKKKRKMGVRRGKQRKKRDREEVSDDDSMAVLIRKSSRGNGDFSIEKRTRSRQNSLRVHDSDFYEFDRDRSERSFKKGQVWAIYDGEDGMPRHYGLIDDVVSVDPFEVRLSWLEFQSSGDHQIISWEKMGFYVSCGRFKVSEKATIKSVKMFSHLADCERAATEVYRIYPKKGSVWAMYNEHALHSEGNNQTMRDKGCYDIVVFLTSYSDIHGSSFAYLEKVDGFKTIFKRREIGAHAISFLEKDEFKLLSHQIPGRKLSEEEAPGLPKYCWELDPASLPPDALSIGWKDSIPL